MLRKKGNLQCGKNFTSNCGLLKETETSEAGLLPKMIFLPPELLKVRNVSYHLPQGHDHPVEESRKG